MNKATEIEFQVQRYYGQELQSSADLKTNACCTATPPPPVIRAALKNIHDEVTSRYYGCGLTIPTCVKGLKVLDLGSGSGRDCYLLAQLVGEQGSVTGVDMTGEQLAVANRHLEWHREKFGYRRSNVKFVQGNIQDLQAAGLQTGDFDLIVSNCVVNLATDKLAVLQEAHRVLKEGGEFYFSDVYCDRRVPSHLVEDRELYGECLSGALYWNDFLALARRAGFADPRIVDSRRLTIENESVLRKTEGFRFYAVTYRLFKLRALEPACEDYGQAVRYKGGVEEHPEQFVLDDHHVFQKGRLVTVCGNTWMMLADTRYREFFDFFGDFSRHFGIFPGCGTDIPYRESADAASPVSGSACC